MGDYSPVLHIDNMSPKMILVLTLVFLIGGALSSALPSANPTDKNTEHVKNEDAENAGCKCIIEGSLVCHQIGTCFVECDSPCLDTEQIVFAGKNQCRSVSACKATKFEIVEPINHYLQNAVRAGVELAGLFGEKQAEHGEVKTKNTEHLENENVESLENEAVELNKDNEDKDNEDEDDEEDNVDEDNKDNKENEDQEHVENDVHDDEDAESTTKSTTSTTESSTISTTTKSTTESTNRSSPKSTISTIIGLPAGCKCIIEGSLVCHQIKTCFVECDSPCLDTKHVVFAGKRQCQSVSACAATKFEIVEPINHYLLG